VQLQWSVTEDTVDVHITPPPGIVGQKSGTLTITPTNTTEYKITARNTYGQSQATVIVHVAYAPIRLD